MKTVKYWRWNMKNYGDKRDYPKIDIYVGGKYVCSTTWAKTCKEAVERYKETSATQELNGEVKACFAT